MIKGFEDAFMDAQSRVVSLSMELMEYSNISVQKIYIYIFQNDCQDYLNAFFEKDGKILRLNDLFTDEQINAFFDCGIEDVENIINVCNTYDSKCPNEFKLIYNVESGAFDADYHYGDFVSEEGIGLVERFEKWCDTCKKEIEME